MTQQFADKSALVTGAGSGMGAATAILLAARGAAVTLVGRRRAKLDEVAAQILRTGGRPLVHEGDVSNPEDVARAVEHTVAEFGGLDFAVPADGRNRLRLRLLRDEVRDRGNARARPGRRNRQRLERVRRQGAARRLLGLQARHPRPDPQRREGLRRAGHPRHRAPAWRHRNGNDRGGPRRRGSGRGQGNPAAEHRQWS